MRLEQLRYLLELYRTRSFSKAAENVFITQPSLSTAISSLEEELGVKLFERSRTGVYPTSVGEEIIKVASEILQRERRIYDIARGDSQVTDHIHLLSIPAACHGILLEAMKVFQQSYSNISIFLREMAPTTIVSEAIRPLNEEPGTFAICTLPPKTSARVIDRLKAENIDAIYLYTDHFVCLMSNKNPHAKEAEISYDDFLSFPEIDLNLIEEIPKNDFFFDMQNTGLDEMYTKLKSNTMIEVDSLSSLKHLVMSEAGITVMPKLIIYKDRDYLSGDIITMPIKGVDITVEFYLLKSNLHTLKPVERYFLDEIILQFQNIDHTS